MSFKQETVVTLKIIGGDELVARLGEPYEAGNAVITLKKPMIVMMAQEGFGLAPFALTAEMDEPVTVDIRNVLTVNNTIKQVADHYMQQTTNLVGIT